MSAQNPINLKGVKNILSARSPITEAEVNEDVEVRIQGKGNVTYVKDKDGVVMQSTRNEGEPLEKRIFNLRAVSQIAMRNPINKALLAEGIAAEKAGDAIKADEFFNAYLNAVQVSFGYLLPNDKLDGKLYDNVKISATVIKVTTDNGILLTIDPKTITIVGARKLGTFNLGAEFDNEEVTGEPVATSDKKPVEA